MQLYKVYYSWNAESLNSALKNPPLEFRRMLRGIPIPRNDA
jgi:hypothetical protein